MEMKVLATGVIVVGFIYWGAMLWAAKNTRPDEKPRVIGFLVRGPFWKSVSSYFDGREEFLKNREIVGLISLLVIMLLFVWFAS